MSRSDTQNEKYLGRLTKAAAWLRGNIPIHACTHVFTHTHSHTRTHTQLHIPGNWTLFGSHWNCPDRDENNSKSLSFKSNRLLLGFTYFLWYLILITFLRFQSPFDFWYHSFWFQSLAPWLIVLGLVFRLPFLHHHLYVGFSKVWSSSLLC